MMYKVILIGILAAFWQMSGAHWDHGPGHRHGHHHGHHHGPHGLNFPWPHGPGNGPFGPGRGPFGTGHGPFEPGHGPFGPGHGPFGPFPFHPHHPWPENSPPPAGSNNPDPITPLPIILVPPTLEPDTTTLGPDTTTSGPETTTLGPDTTTSGPDTTTLGPDTTTLGPDTTGTPPSITTVPAVATTPPPVESSTTETLEACKRRCPVTSEYNPVCGTDNVTYDNMGMFECARNCGADIQILKSGSCTANTTNKVDVLSCMKDCRIKNELSPVCGTNNVTYANIEGLECVQRCGVDVVYSRDGVCEVEVTPSPPVTERKCIETSTQPPQPSSTEAAIKTPTVAELTECMILCPFHGIPITTESISVCGTDGITYENPSLLLCYQYCGVDIKVQNFTACSTNAPPVSEPTVDGSTTAAVEGSHSTDPSVTESVVPGVKTPTIPSTVPPVPDTTESEEYEIDERFQKSAKRVY